jgi:predicted O-methyltransferase YrrM
MMRPSASSRRHEDVVERLLAERPIFHAADTAWSWPAQPKVLRALAGHVSPGDRTLEVGCGASSVVFVAMGAEHTAISPDPWEHGKVREYCDRLGLDHSSLELIEGYSDRVLPRLERAGELAVAFIDGDHSFPYPAVDWHYVNRMLRVGGVMLLDDVQSAAVGVVCRSMVASPNWDCLEVIERQAAVFRKLADGYLDWQEDPFSRSPDYWFLGGRGARKQEALDWAWGVKERIETRLPALRRLRRRLRRRPCQ